MKPSPSSTSTSASPLRRARLLPLVFWFLAFVLFVVVMYSEDLASSLSHHLRLQLQLQALDNYDRSPSSLDAPAGNMRQQKPLPFSIGTAPEGCDYFSGRWVKDDLIRHPLYGESQCPYIQPQLTCQQHGRPDKGYQQWRWQPHGCSLPRRWMYVVGTGTALLVVSVGYSEETWPRREKGPSLGPVRKD